MSSSIAGADCRSAEKLLVIVHFDGECLLCSRSVRFIARRDRSERIRFKRLDHCAESLVVECGGRRHQRSAAVLVILRTLGGHWRLLAAIGRWIPKSLRDALYRWIAGHRHDWFGKAEVCDPPDEAVSRRMLD